jgi:methionine synthase I (cobalamin-dependent)
LGGCCETSPSHIKAFTSLKWFFCYLLF